MSTTFLDPNTYVDGTVQFITYDSVFMDAALSYAGSPATVFSGLNHLIGKAVSVLADGNVVSGKIVSDAGTVTLDKAASVVYIGLPYKSRLQTMRLEYDAQGTAQGKKKKLAIMFVRVDNTRAMYIGPSEDKMVEVKFRDALPFGSVNTVFSGDKRIAIEPSWGTDGQVMVVQTDPLPITILALIPEIETSAQG